MRIQLCALLALLLSTPALAHPTGHGDSTYYQPAPTVAPTVIPDTYPGVVAALRQGLTTTETALNAFKIADLHKSCTTLKDLAAAAPAKASVLPADARATVATTVTHLQGKVAELIVAADKGDITAAKAVITAIRADVDVLGGFVK